MTISTSRVAIYARCSDAKQAERDLSIPAQIDEARRWASSNRCEVVHEYIEPGESARTDDRPAFQQMIEDAGRKPRPFDVVLVWKFNRFARSRKDSVGYKYKLRRRGVRVVSINEPISDDPVGRMVEGVLESLDEFYSDNLRPWRPNEHEAAAVTTSRRLVETFEEMNGDTNCLELTDTDMQNLGGVFKYFVKAGPIRCGRMAVKFAPVAFQTIEESMAEEPVEATSHCASCAAAVARRLGASEQHVVMAAGLAGGIGLSGGGCGALGAAIWITGMNPPEEKTGLSADGTTIGEVIEAFVEASDHEYECAEIAGRRFEDAADHGRYMEAGGCARILDALVQAAGGNVALEDEGIAA